MCSSVTVAVADDAIDARIAKVTPGYTLYVTKTLQMQSVKPFAFDTARGDCFVFVLRADAGGAFAESAIGQVAVDLKERSRGFSLDPDVAADGGVTRSYCPLVDGKVTFGAYQFVVDKKHPSGFHNVKLGKGGLRVEIVLSMRGFVPFEVQPQRRPHSPGSTQPQHDPAAVGKTDSEL